MEWKDLELVVALADHLEEEVDALASELLEPSGRDQKRLFRGVVRRVIFAREGGVCWYCGRSLEYRQVQIDHVIPWSQGGRTIEKNGVASCGPCNRAKSAKVW